MVHATVLTCVIDPSPPSAWMTFTASVESRRSTRQTFAPSAASARAMVKPTPIREPVTTAFWPTKRRAAGTSSGRLQSFSPSAPTGTPCVCATLVSGIFDAVLLNRLQGDARRWS